MKLTPGPLCFLWKCLHFIYDLCSTYSKDRKLVALRTVALFTEKF
jgi:hypothetical protein